MKRPLFSICLAVVLFTAACLWVHPPTYVSYGETAGEEVYLTGKVYAKEFKKGFQGPILLIYIEPERLSFHQENISYCDNFICALKSGSREPAIGSTVTVRGILTEYEQARNPGQFDARTYYAILGISAQIKNGELLEEGKGYDRLQESLWRLRKSMANVMDQIFTEEDAAVLKTMLLGDKTSLNEETKNLYREAGILHILAISGLHITVLGMGLYKLLRKIYIPVMPASVLCGILMLLYGIMVGMPVSAMRAIGMFLLRLLAGCIGRTYDMLTALLVCAAAMVVEQPLYLYHAGFLLSFSAVLAVGILKPVLTPPVDENLPFLDGFFTTLVITVFTMPIQLYFYYEVSVYAIFLNLLVLPLVGYVLTFATGALAVFFLCPGVAEFLSLFVHLILSSYIQGCAFISNLSGSLWMPGRPEQWQILCFLFLLGMILFLKKLEWKYKIGLLCGAVLIFGVKERTGLTVTFLDVGQGDCICLELPNGENWLVDGGSSDVSGVGTYRIEPFLKSRGIHTLQAIFLSHPDSDHINGVMELLDGGGIEIELLVLPCTQKDDTEGGFDEILTLAGQRDIPVLWLREGMKWESAGVRAACLHPGEDFSAGSTNAASEVLSLSYGAFSLLLTGDVEGDGEEALAEKLKEKQMGEFTLLKVAHHGSAYSTSEEFLDMAAPAYTVVSCGADNSYGHPHAELLDRLTACGAKTFITYETGAVSFWTDGERLRVERYLEE